MARPIPQLPAEQRPRERLFRVGAPGLSDAELLGLVLGAGRAGVTATEVAEELLAAHGGLDRLRQVSPDRLATHPGIGPARAAQVVAALALARRSSTPPVRMVRNSADVAALVAPLLADAATERVAAVVVDGRHRVVRVEGSVRAVRTAPRCRSGRSSPWSCGMTGRRSPWRTTTRTATSPRVRPT
jgi:DNA repair protein RadC